VDLVLLAVKHNQKRLEQAFDDIFDLSDLQNEREKTYSIQEKLHGRSESRLHKVRHDIDALGDIALE
jgi:predicted transposase YbfD/YdcC